MKKFELKQNRGGWPFCGKYVRNLRENTKDKIYKLVNIQHPLKKMNFRTTFNFDDGWDSGTNLQITFDIQRLLKIKMLHELE